MDNKATLSALVIGIILGCASSQATEIASVNAEPTPAAAPAPAGTLSECAVLELDGDNDLDDLDDDVKKITGWVPVGGAGERGVVLCR